MDRNIWVDLDNSPHVPFFNPIIRELKNREYHIIVTVRDCFQVVGLSNLFKIEGLPIGKHYGKNMVLKLYGTILRAIQLSLSVSNKKPILAISHGSRAQLIAARLMGIQSIVIADYEHSKGISIIRPETLIVPELLVDSIGWKSSKNIRSYPGIKEDVYVPDFKPDDSIIDELGIKENCIIVTLRPPAIEAHYHNPESEVLFIRTVNFLLSNPNTVLVILPRNVEKEAPEIRSKWKKYVENRKIIIPEKVVNGLNLIWNSDLVISGGGTMNREAAALNIPVFSIFRGQLGEVDKYLIRQKRLIMISSAEEIENQIFIRKRIINDETINKSKEALYKIVSIIEKNVQEVS